MHDLIVFGEDYGGLPSSTQHLINHLATERKVVWVNSIGLRKPKMTINDAKRLIKKCLSGKKTLSSDYSSSPQNNNNIKQVNLLTIPAPSSGLARGIAREMMLYQLQPILQSCQLEKPILWSSLPTAADLCGHLGESAVIYYCGDDFSSLSGVDHVTVAKHEQKMANKADLILTASEVLNNKFPACKTQLLAHGVDTELFSQPVNMASDLKAISVANKRPIAGFYGSISEWLDYRLLGQVIEQLSDWDFVFIGPLSSGKNPLPNRDNVHYLGPRSHDELPSYSQHWDVSMLPFILNNQIVSCNPLKLMEYMAAGRPIVSTDFPALNGYRQHVHCAENTEEFISSLLKAKNASVIPTNAIQQQSWQEKSLFLSWLMELL